MDGEKSSRPKIERAQLDSFPFATQNDQHRKENLLLSERMEPSLSLPTSSGPEIHPLASEVRERQPSPSPSPSPTKRARLDASSSFSISEAGGGGASSLGEGIKGSTSGWLKRSNPFGSEDKDRGTEEKGVDMVSSTRSLLPPSSPPSPDPFLVHFCYPSGLPYYARLLLSHPSLRRSGRNAGPWSLDVLFATSSSSPRRRLSRLLLLDASLPPSTAPSLRNPSLHQYSRSFSLRIDRNPTRSSLPCPRRTSQRQEEGSPKKGRQEKSRDARSTSQSTSKGFIGLGGGCWRL